MKVLFIGILTVMSLSSLANTHKDMREEYGKEWDKMSFEDQKKMKLEMLDKKSAMMNKDRTCVNNAKDKVGLKGCHDMMMKEMDAMKSDMRKDVKQSQEAKPSM